MEGNRRFPILHDLFVESSKNWTSIHLRDCQGPWAVPGVPMLGTRRVMPTTIAPKCLVESKTRAGTSKSHILYLVVVVVINLVA